MLKIALILTLILNLGPIAVSLAGTVIESIGGGDKTVAVIFNKVPGKASVGTKLRPGNRVKTGADVTVVILYSDGSRVTLSRNTDYEVEDKIKETQWNRLRSGQVRGVVTKVKDGGGGEHRRPRFLVRTKTAVLGVRGTDFVMSLNPANAVAQVHTIEGTVEVANSETSLLSGQGTPLTQGKFIEANPGGMGTPKSFDTTKFLKNLDSANPTDPSHKASSDTGSSSTQSEPEPSSTQAPSSPSTPAEAPSAPSLSPPPRLTPPPGVENLPEQAQRQSGFSNETRGRPRRLRLLSFQVGGLFGFPGDDVYRAFHASWTPIVPIPFTGFLSARGEFGGDFFRNGSLNNTLAVHEYHLFVQAAIMSTFLLEAGVGRQYWLGNDWSGRVLSVNVGLFLRDDGWVNRIFIGHGYFSGNTQFHEYKAGIGIGL